MTASREFGWYNRNCAVNPYLIEGKKTAALELAEQFLWMNGSPFPDWVVVSVGDGCTIGGVWKGFKEMHALGLLPRLPRILGVQADGSKPFVDAWNGNGVLQPGEASTVADSICVGHPRNFAKGMKAVTESNGAFIAVPDEEILAAIPLLARKAGVFVEPAGAAAAAGLKAALAQGIVGRNESAVLLATGNGLKDIQSAMRICGQATAIEPNIDAVRRAVPTN
jgi:threonine synthase